mmetsp:Transcript_38205/g.89417  ORF Transcript_38205/g.89417 Transcript_38205/m.89417 type:complete len:208 (-) Transcript_38205:1537-2160(-)
MLDHMRRVRSELCQLQVLRRKVLQAVSPTTARARKGRPLPARFFGHCMRRFRVPRNGLRFRSWHRRRRSACADVHSARRVLGARGHPALPLDGLWRIALQHFRHVPMAETSAASSPADDRVGRGHRAHACDAAGDHLWRLPQQGLSELVDHDLARTSLRCDRQAHSIAGLQGVGEGEQNRVLAALSGGEGWNGAVEGHVADFRAGQR